MTPRHFGLKADINGIAPLSERDLGILCNFIYARTGMKFGESKRYYIDRRVADRMAARRTKLFADYHALLHVDHGEVEKLINSFTVNETYFYREEHQLS